MKTKLITLLLFVLAFTHVSCVETSVSTKDPLTGAITTTTTKAPAPGSIEAASTFGNALIVKRNEQKSLRGDPSPLLLLRSPYKPRNPWLPVIDWKVFHHVSISSPTEGPNPLDPPWELEWQHFHLPQFRHFGPHGSVAHRAF